MRLPFAFVLFKLPLFLLCAVGTEAVRDGAGLESRQSSGGLVFCHFMVCSYCLPILNTYCMQIGITSNRASASDYDADMKRAKAIGIDAFALNIGVDPFTDQQLGFAYESANNNEMKVFISFDFNWYKDTSDAATVGSKIAKYGSLPAQLKVDNKVFVSSFAGDHLDIATVRSTAGMDLMIVPNFHPQDGTDFSAIDGALNWIAWDNDGNNKAPQGGKTVTVSDGDQTYLSKLGSKFYLARKSTSCSVPEQLLKIPPAVSPWFSTHFGISE